MIAGSPILAVLLCLSFQAFGNPISSEDIQICTHLCNKCNGKTIIKEGKCECSIADDDKKGAECMKRITRKAEFGMTFEIPETHAQEEGRLVRCLHGSRRKYKPEDVQKIAEYFMGGGPLAQSPLGQTCKPSDKMVGASEPDLEEPPHSDILEFPKLAEIEPEEDPPLSDNEPEEEAIVGASKENPWCPSSVFEKSQSGPVQPENTYAKSDNIVGSPQELQEPDVCPAESEEIVGSPPELEQPQGFSLTANGMFGDLQQLQLPQIFPDQSGIVGAAQQPFSESGGFLGSLQLQLPQLCSANSGGMLGSSQAQQPLVESADPRGISGNFQLKLPQFSPESRNMLGSSQAEGLSSNPAGFLGNLQLQLPQISADSSRLDAPQSPGLSSSPSGFLGNLQWQLPEGLSADSGLLGAAQPIELPQISPAVLGQMMNPQPIFDVVEAIGRIQIPVPQTQNLDSGINDATKNTDSDIVGAARKVCPLRSTETVDASLDNSGDTEPNLGASLPVQPGYTNPADTSDSAPKTAAPQIQLYTLNDLVAALAQRPLTSIFNGLGRFQIPQNQVGTSRQEPLEAPTSNSDSNDDANDVENAGDAASPHDDAEPDELDDELDEVGDELDEADDESSVGAPVQPTIGTSGLSWIPQTVSSVIGIFQPLVQQGLQLAMSRTPGQTVGLESPQVGMTKSQTDSSDPQVGSATPETNPGAPRIAVLNSPLLRAQYIPNANGYLINSQFSLPMLQVPSSPTVGATRLNQKNNGPNLEESSDDEQIVGAPRKTKQISKKRISQRGSGLKKIRQRPRTLPKRARQPLRKRLSKSNGLSNSKALSDSKGLSTSKRLSTSKGLSTSKKLTKRKFPREAMNNSEELPDEVLNSEANAETTEKIMEEAFERETLKKSEEITLEKELEKTSEKTLEKRADKTEVKLIEPEVKLIELDVKLIEPEVKLMQPEAKLIEPEVKLVEPKVKSVEPEVKLVEPKVKLFEPEVKLVEPVVNVVEPKVKLVEPEEKSVKKVTDKTNLKIKITTSM